MYQALYRKYRPNNFGDVVGQEIIVKTLQNAIKNNTLTHAYLFTGPRGTGKTSVAKILAKTINCLKLNNGMPCEECVVCTQIKSKSFVDIIEIDAASNNGVDEIRELKNKITLVPTLGKYKVYIIDEVHMLTTGAFNALLKTLEEPPGHVIFILATTDPQKIPSTILSRCQRFDFKRINDESICFRLKNICEIENIKISDESIKEIARLCDGGMRDALSMLDQVNAFSDEEISISDIHNINGSLSQENLIGFVQNIFNKDLYNCLTLIDKWNSEGKNLYKIAEELILFFKNILIALEAPNYLEEKGLKIQCYNSFSKNISKFEVIKVIEIFNKDLNDLKKSNVPKLVFEIVIIKIMNMEEKKTIKKDIELKKVKDKEEKNFSTIKELDKNIIVDSKIKENLKNIKNIRINNVLAKFDKKELIELQKQQDDFKPLLINPDYSNYISMILDGILKAASEDSMIYVFDSEINSDLFNENLLRIEEIIEQVLGKKYKVISTDIISWEIIKKEFNNKTKKYEYKEEDFDIEIIFKNKESSNEIENLFSSSIEYK